MSSFEEIIQKLLLSDNKKCKEGVKQIEKKLLSNLYLSLIECRNIMTNDNEKKEICRFSTTCIRYIFNHENYLNQWELFQE